MQPVAERGGSDHAQLRLCRYLVAQGWEFHAVFPTAPPLAAELKAAGAVVHVVPMRRLTRSAGRGYFLGYARDWPVSVARLWQLGLRVRPSVVHSNSAHCWYGWPVAWLLRRPHVWHAREIVVQSGSALRLERLLARYFAWRVAAVSGPVADQFPGSKVVVVHDALGAEDGFSPGHAGHFRAGAGMSDELVLLGAAGRLDTWKGFDLLLDAFPLIRKQRPDVHLAIAGAPVPGKEAYAAHLEAKAGAMAGVHWLGARQDMAELMADLDLFVLASTEPEPFASSALEALACGVPVVAADHGGSPEMLAACPEAAGRLFAPRDARALAEAALAVLPPWPSSTARRRARPSCLVGDPTAFTKLFELALSRAGH